MRGDDGGMDDEREQEGGRQEQTSAREDSVTRAGEPPSMCYHLDVDAHTRRTNITTSA
jgi:hypothetical protein